MNVKERSTGGVKTCRIHDLLHDFCLKKAKEESFLHLLIVVGKGEQKQSCSDDFDALSFGELQYLSSLESRNVRRLCVYSEPEHLKSKVYCPCLRSLLFFPPTSRDEKLDNSFNLGMFKLLRVLDADQVELPKDSEGVGGLVQLRYLAIKTFMFVSPAIGNLSNIQTLILNAIGVVTLPDTLWNLRKLRHLYTLSHYIKLPIGDSNSSCNLLELETLSNLYVRDWSLMEKKLRKFPNIRRIKCELRGQTRSKVTDFSFLSQLESFSLRCNSRDTGWIFPENIKKLILFGIDFTSNNISSIAKLPYFEVLKLLQSSFAGNTWYVEEGEISKLKFLKLESSNLINWTAASDDLFPNLEKLVLKFCSDLEEVPECLENVATLERIEVIYCPDHVVSLLKKVEECHKKMGNSVLQFHECEMRFFEDDQFSTGSEDSKSDTDTQ